MEIVVCNVNMFDAEQSVYILNDETAEYKLIGKCPTEELGKILTNVCFAHNINKIHLTGHDIFLNDIAENIDACSGCNAYSNGMIKVEVN